MENAEIWASACLPSRPVTIKKFRIVTISCPYLNTAGKMAVNN